MARTKILGTFLDFSSSNIEVTSDSSSFIRNSTDNDLKFTFVTNNSSDFAQLIMAGKDGGVEKFMIAYGSTHSSTPNMLALKSNDNGSGSVGFFTNSAERARFDVNGRFGIGTTSPSARLQVVNTTSSTIPALGAASSHVAFGGSLFGTMIGSLSSGKGYIQQQRFDGTATAYDLAIQPNGGTITFSNAYSFPTSDGSANQVLQTDGSGALSFATISSGSSTSISDADGDTKIQVEESSDEDKIRFDVGGNEKMRINSSGQVSINDTTDPDNAAEFLQVRGTSNSVGPVAIRNSSGDQSFYRMLHYYKKEETSPIGATAIDITGSAISHTFLSDERLKDELGAADGMNLISQLKPIKFKFKDGTGTGSQGFTAQAFKQAFDNVGSYARGVVVPDNADEYWYLDDKVLIPNLVKALQEQQAIIDDLKARIEALESE
jgi:hypothetical protein